MLSHFGRGGSLGTTKMNKIATTGDYIVRKGDTLSSLADKFNMSVSQLVAANPQFASLDGGADKHAERAKALSDSSDRNGNFIYPGDVIHTAEPTRCVDPAALSAQAPPPAKTTNAKAPAAKAATSPATTPRAQASRPAAKTAAPAPNPAASAPNRAARVAEAGKPPAETRFTVKAAGLQGPVSDLKLLQHQNYRLLALRSLADVGDGKGGAPDHVVDAKEAKDYLTQTKKALRDKKTANDDPTALSENEQKALIDAARDHANTLPNGAGNRALYQKATQSFDPSAGEWTQAHPDAININKAFVGAVVPTVIGLTPHAYTAPLLATDKAGSVSLKLFTPNVNAFKSAVPLQSKSAATLSAPAGAEGTLKAHGWGAERTEIALSRVFVAKDGTQLRSLTISGSLVAQNEMINELNLPRGAVRWLDTNSTGKQGQYEITASKERIADIVNGKVAPPNPYDMKTMKEGDTVTFTSGSTSSHEDEGRGLFGVGQARAGFDGKVDKSAFHGSSRLVVRALKAGHVQVFQGTSEQSASALGAGLIWNPKIKNGAGGLEKASQGMFLRELLQARETKTDNMFHWVEVDTGDASPGGGAQVYQRILKNSQVPTGQTGQSLDGVLAHGQLDYNSDAHPFSWQQTFYEELPKSLSLDKLWGGSKGGRIGQYMVGSNTIQAVLQSNIDLSADTIVNRDIYVADEKRGSQVRDYYTPGGYHDAIRVEAELGSGTSNDQHVYSAIGDTHVTDSREVNEGTGATYAHPWALGQNSGSTHALIEALGAIEKDRAAGKSPLLEDLAVRVPDGKGGTVDLRGKAALDALKASDQRNSRILIETKADSKRDNGAKIDDFIKQYRHDYMAYNKHGDGILERIGQSLFDQSATENQMYAYLLGYEEMNTQDGGFNYAAIANAKNLGDIEHTISGFDLGQMIMNLQRYRSQVGDQITGASGSAYYPIRVLVVPGS